MKQIILKKCQIKNFTIGIGDKNSFVKAKDFILSVHSIEYRESVVILTDHPWVIVKDVLDLTDFA